MRVWYTTFHLRSGYDDNQTTPQHREVRYEPAAGAMFVKALGDRY